jgi:hypothetical protein
MKFIKSLELTYRVWNLSISLLPPKSRIARFLRLTMRVPSSVPSKPLLGKERCSNEEALKTLKLCGAVVDRPCASTETTLVSTPSAEQKDRRFAFVIGFGAFFGVGVLYDRIVLSKYFG